jgi:hypothetical protein
VTVVVEATLQWAWLHDRLTAAGFTVLVAHPKQVKLISHARCKTDPIDARKLADLARTNLLPTIWDCCCRGLNASAGAEYIRAGWSAAASAGPAAELQR